MGVYQVIIIVLYSVSVGVSLVKDGEEVKRKISFYRSLIFFGLIMFCLYKGGFFNQ